MLIHLEIKVLVEADGFAVEVHPAFLVAEEFHVLALQDFKTFGLVRTAKGYVEEYEWNAPGFWFFYDYNVQESVIERCLGRNPESIAVLRRIADRYHQCRTLDSDSVDGDFVFDGLVFLE